MTKNKLIVISTGGTGGHVFPAQAIADKLVSKNYSLHLVTDKRALKYLDGAFLDMRKTVILASGANEKFSSKLLNFT